MQVLKVTAPLLMALLLAAAPVIAANDDEVVEGPINPNPEENVHALGAVDFDQIVFQNVGEPGTAVQQLQAQMDLQLAELTRVCQLTESQQQKLQLAARGDLKRFQAEVDVKRRKFNAHKNDASMLNNIWQEIEPLHAKMTRGLTGPGSLFLKIVPTTLTPQQTSQYDAHIHERRLYSYRANIAMALNMLEENVAFTQKERDAITDLLLTLPAPKGANQYAPYLIMYRLSDLPPDKLKSLLDKRRCEALNRQFDVYRGSREALIQQGMISQDDLATAEESKTEKESQP